MPITRGCSNYFKIVDVQGIFGTLDGWIRRKIRGLLWKQWKNPRTRLKKLVAKGIKPAVAKPYAYASKGPWRMSKTQVMHKAYSNREIESMGYLPMMNLVCARSK
jgi:hypothetical protein